MSLIQTIIDFILHLDKYLTQIIQNYGVWTYLLLFFVIFMETGFVVTPFLPGDSLIFAAGTIAGISPQTLHVAVLFVIFSLAAILGDTANYWIGHYIGPRAFSGNIRFLKKEYIDQTREFFEKYGGKTIILARFIPIIRTFAPFVAGVGAMHYRRFILYNILGGLAWVTLFLMGGYFFGNLAIVQKNFAFVIIAIVIISLVPAAIEFFNARKKRKSATRPSAEA